MSYSPRVQVGFPDWLGFTKGQLKSKLHHFVLSVTRHHNEASLSSGNAPCVPPQNRVIGRPGIRRPSQPSESRAPGHAAVTPRGAAYLLRNSSSARCLCALALQPGAALRPPVPGALAVASTWQARASSGPASSSRRWKASAASEDGMRRCWLGRWAWRPALAEAPRPPGSARPPGLRQAVGSTARDASSARSFSPAVWKT